MDQRSMTGSGPRPGALEEVAMRLAMIGTSVGITALACACSPTPASEQAAANDSTARVYSSARHDFRVTTVADGLDHPWSMAWLPGGEMLIVERPGRASGGARRRPSARPGCGPARGLSRTGAGRLHGRSSAPRFCAEWLAVPELWQGQPRRVGGGHCGGPGTVGRGSG